MLRWVFLPLYFLAIYSGLVLPVPGVILAWREWAKKEKLAAGKTWRHVVSLIALFICTFGAALWIYTMAVARWSELNASATLHASSWPISVGSWAAFPAIAASALAEGKLRKYLLACAVGLFFFFNWTMGEAI